MAAFLHAISSCGTVSSSNSMRKETKLAIWRQILHITPLLYKVYLPITEGFAELEHYVSCTNSWVLGINTNIHWHSAMWMRLRNISFCNRQICNIQPQKQPYPIMQGVQQTKLVMHTWKYNADSSIKVRWASVINQGGHLCFDCFESFIVQFCVWSSASP